MRFFEKSKDGGPESTVDAYWLIEIKSLFSIALLKFNPGSRGNYHSHAFNALSWYLGGAVLIESVLSLGKRANRCYRRSLFPKVTGRGVLHKVFNNEDHPAYIFTVRGPWHDTWTEYNEERDETITLTHGRKVVNS